MGIRILLLMTVFIISGCGNVDGQYKHDKGHHKKQSQQRNFWIR